MYYYFVILQVFLFVLNVCRIVSVGRGAHMPIFGLVRYAASGNSPALENASR